MIFILEKLLCILLSLGMLWHALLISRFARSWLVPSCIFSVAWFLLTFIPLIAVPGAPANPVAIGYILACCLAFSIGAVVTDWKKVFVPDFERVIPSDLFDTTLLRGSFFVFCAIAIGAVLANAWLQGVSPAGLISNFYEVSSMLISQRYLDDSPANNIFSQVGNVSCYLAVCVGGLVFPGYKTRSGKAIVLAAAMFPALFVISVFGAKGMIFLCIAFFWAGTLVRRLQSGDLRMMERRTIVRGLAGIAILTPFITVSFLARGLYNSSGDELVWGLKHYYASYVCGHLYAFSDWFSWYIGQNAAQIYAEEPVTGGFYTFTSLFVALGSKHPVIPGMYAEYFSYSDYLTSNIYTFFRGLITDFSFFGSFVFLAVVGFFCNSMFVLMAKGKYLSFTVAFFIFSVGYIYTSFIISLLVWNSVYVVVIVQWVLLEVSSLTYQDRQTRRQQIALASERMG